MQSTVGVQLNLHDPFDGLTSKQQQFVAFSFSGLSDVQSYRQAYDVAGMSERSILHEAAKVAHNALVTAKLRQLQDRRDAKSILASDLTQDWILKRLMQLAEKATKESVKVTALIALGKTVGIDLFRETTRVVKAERTGEEIDRELEQRLRDLVPVIEGKVNTVSQAAPTPDRRRKPRA